MASVLVFPQAYLTSDKRIESPFRHNWVIPAFGAAPKQILGAVPPMAGRARRRPARPMSAPDRHFDSTSTHGSPATHQNLVASPIQRSHFKVEIERWVRARITICTIPTPSS